MAFISNVVAMKAAAVAALLVMAAVSPAARAQGGAPSVPAGPLDIAQLGAKGDGKSDSTPMLLKAWKNACDATGVQKIVIPPGNYLTGGMELQVLHHHPPRRQPARHRRPQRVQEELDRDRERREPVHQRPRHHRRAGRPGVEQERLPAFLQLQGPPECTYGLLLQLLLSKMMR